MTAAGKKKVVFFFWGGGWIKAIYSFEPDRNELIHLIIQMKVHVCFL